MCSPARMPLVQTVQDELLILLHLRYSNRDACLKQFSVFIRRFFMHMCHLKTYFFLN